MHGHTPCSWWMVFHILLHNFAAGGVLQLVCSVCTRHCTHVLRYSLHNRQPALLGASCQVCVCHPGVSACCSLEGSHHVCLHPSRACMEG
jgi:hypothetical protein